MTSFTHFKGESYALFKIIILAIFSSVNFASIITNRPFNSSYCQTIEEIFSAVFAWCNWVLLLTQILSGSTFTAALEILFLGIPIIIALIITRNESRLKLLMTSEKHIATAEECRAKNFFYFFIIDTREMNRQSGIILKGYVNHHCEVCPFDSCPIRAFKRLMNSEKLSAHILERRKFATSDAKNLHSDNNSLLQA